MKNTSEPLSVESVEDECCKICERVKFGKIVYLGFNHWRHDECGLGSEAWKLYYETQSKTIKTVLEEFHRFNYQPEGL